VTPYKINFESNKRIINDYGKQKRLGSWEEGDFTTRKGFTFRGVGKGQAPRGARSGEKRPDIIEFDDLDTDEDVLNEDTIDKDWKWVTNAVIPTRSISRPTLIRWNGNIIAEDCCIVRAAAYADHVDTVNIRDEDGVSTWPKKNSEEHIDRVLSQVPYSTQRKEYYNDPHVEGKSFKTMTWGKCPPLEAFQFLVAYADPATSNKDISALKKQKNSCKAVALVGKIGLKYYVLKVFVHNVPNSQFIEWLYFMRQHVGGRTALYSSIENNSLQDPFYQQVLLPLMHAKASEYGSMLPIMPDERKKPDKFFRIEGTLQPLNNMGLLVLNIDEKDDPHMKRLEAQFKGVSPKSKTMDGPDAVEGAVYIINQKGGVVTSDDVHTAGKSRSSSKHL
jgi:hypothetical protein